MKPTELAKIYMMSFFGKKPLKEMQSILAEDLIFTGTFYKYNTAEDYIQSLKENMPTDEIAYEILQEYENENSCCLVYQTRKQGLEETMAQLFEVNENKITRIRLILDASKLLK
jgi:hypothetical protein